MVPSKSKRSESRRSSILKPRKPRQPLQNVNFDSSSNENSPVASKVKRRVSFADKKHVKEFCHSTEQGTVWDNTYEEHDSSLKGSFVVYQNTEVESKENSCTSTNDYTHIYSENNSCYPNNACLVNNQLLQESFARVNEKDDDTSCNLDLINSVKPITLSNKSQLEYAALPNKSCVSKDAVVSSGIVEYSDTDEECMELPDEESQSRQTVTNISYTSKTVKSSNITIYRDSDEEDYTDVVNKHSSKLCSKNVNSEFDKTHVQDLSIELTAPISALLLSSHLHTEEQERKKHNDISNLDTNYTTNCNNVSMEITEAIPLFAKSVISDLGISEQIPTILQKCENIKWDDTNTHKTTDVNYVNDSMVLTSVIQPFTDTGTCCTNNPVLDTSMEMISVSSKIYGKNTCNENIVKEDDLKKDQTDKTEIFNDVLMEMTKPVNTILSSNIYNKKNFRMDEPISKDDRTIFYDVSMEMTKIVSTESKQEIVDTNVNCKSSEENAHDGKDVNISILNEGTKTLCKSMEFTEAVPAPLYYERMFHAAQSINKSTCEDYKNDRTEFFNDDSMEITKSVNMLPLNIDKENLKSNESISKDGKTMFFHNVSMETTTAVLSRNQNEIIQPITCKSIFKESTQGEKDTNNSTCCNEGTKLLCKSMEFTEVVPISLHDERTFNTTHTATQSTFSQTLSKTSLPAENFTGVTLQTDVAADKTIQDTSISAAALSTLQLMQDIKINKIENVIISKNDEFQHLMTSNLTKPNKSITREDFTISKEIVETENIRHNESSNVIVTQSPLDNLDHSSNANFENVSDKKGMSDTSGRLYSKRVRDSFIEVQFSQENDIHSFPNANASYISNIERKECFVKDIMDHTQVSNSNLRDSLNEISENSFLKKSLAYLENSLVELQSIKPPSFVCLDSEEENSFHKVQSSIITDIPVNNTSTRLINNLTEFKYLEEALINTEDNQTENCYKSTIVDEIEDNQETNCQTIRKTIINDNQSSKSNATKNINEESLLNAKNGKVHLTVPDINHCTSLTIKKIVVMEDQIDERKHIRKRLNEDAKLQNDIEEREQYSDKKRQKTENSDYFENTGTIEDQIDSEERRKNLNDEVKQNIEQKGECATKRLVTAQYIHTIEDVTNRSLTEQDPFLILSQKLETHAAREDCIWNVYYKNIDKKMIVFGFMSNSLLVATFLSYNINCSEENLIKEVKVISRISDDAGVLIRIAHKLILEKINAKILTSLYKTHDIFPLLNFISQDVKLAMNFMFDLRRLDDLNLMEIDHDEISFVSRSKRMDIILRVTIKVKQFDKLTSNDISLCCLLGRIKETDIKNLIKNVKKDHKFLRRYMNDVKDYIDIIEETQTI